MILIPKALLMKKIGALYQKEECYYESNNKRDENKDYKIIIPPIIHIVQNSYHDCCDCPLYYENYQA
jgi:hypothetical protein